MTKGTRLTDIQLILLTAAAARDTGSLLPPPSSLGDALSRIGKDIASLIRRRLAQEIDVAPGTDVWRCEGTREIGVIITDAGRASIGIDVTPTLQEVVEGQAGNSAVRPDVSERPSSPPPAAHTKTALVLQLLTRETGATLDELIAATSWLPHTTRAALTGLRKKGHGIDRRKRGEVTCYHLVQA